MRLALPLALLSSLLLFTAPAQAADTVTISGTAYEFNKVEVKLGGASIRVAEDPSIRTTAKADGTYKLRVPERKPATIYIVHPGYHTIYTQTFTPFENLERVNLQTPTEDVYKALAALLNVQLDSGGNPQQCAIVSTFMTRNVRTATFDEFTGYGAHGVAGATAAASPMLPSPIYFNENVVPDRSQPSSSDDGGVIWTEVPRGTYSIRGSSPTTEFASFVATCEPGRIVNANPQWGLYELGLPNPANVSAKWAFSKTTTFLSALRVTKLPKGGSITVRCSGPGCPFSSRKVRTGGKSTVNVGSALGSAKNRIAAHQTLELQIDAPARDSRVVRWKLRAGKEPHGTALCVPLGFSKPRGTAACGEPDE